MAPTDPTTSEASAIDEGYGALRRGEGVVVLDRDIVEVTGPEAETFLQGQLSQDVTALAPGTGAWTFVLEPTGKVGALMRIVRDRDGGFLLDVDAGTGETVVARLNRFKLRTKAEIALADRWVSAARPLTGEPQAMHALAETSYAYVLGDVRYLLVQAPADDLRGADHVDATSFEPWRIEKGIPKMGAELITGETIPAEVGQWLIDAAVSFTKGCYTGQELVARIDSRGGNVPRHLRGLVIEADRDSMPPTGTEVVVEDKVVGTVTSVAWSPGFGRPVALASIGRAIEPPADAELRWHEGAEIATATINTLPMAPPD